MSAPPVARSAPDRRARRRQDTITEILDVALGVMAENGAGGLSLGEVARRVGMRPPSLYQYFESKNAVYDALFARGWQAINGSMAGYDDLLQAAEDSPSARSLLCRATSDFVRWAVEHPVYAQLMFWRPVPGFEPSSAAYEPAVQAMDRFESAVRFIVARGWLHPDAASDQGLRSHTTMVSGVISQHLANEPAGDAATDRFTSLVPMFIDMFFDRFAPEGAPRDGGHDDPSRTAATDPAATRRRGGRRPDGGLRGAAARSRPR